MRDEHGKGEAERPGGRIVKPREKDALASKFSSTLMSCSCLMVVGWWSK